MSKVLLDGQIIDFDKAMISASDSGFLYGAGLFETMRAVDGAVFCIDDHLDRLFNSAAELMININYEKEQLKKFIYDLLDANGLKDARIRLTMSNGKVSIDNHSSTIYITAGDFKSYPHEYYKKGISVVLANYKQNPADPTTGHKTTSYFPRLLALEQARVKNCVEAIWFTVDNKLAEGSISNIFIVKDGALFTPSKDIPILPGIARKNIIQIASQRKVEFFEKSLYIHDLLEADEIFLTNVIMKVLPVISIEKHTISNGKVGKMTAEFLECFEILLKQSKR